jgi:D-sedoheptulose 7-phosphate isomerase
MKALCNLAEVCANALQSGGKILFAGNGGSAADAQHLATELTVRFVRDRRALAAIALTTYTSVLTACGNDLGFDKIFERQVEALGRPGDVYVAITTSGKSVNIVRSLEKVRETGLIASAYTGATGAKLAVCANPLVIVPSKTTSRIQEMHMFLGRLLCGEIEARLGLA